MSVRASRRLVKRVVAVGLVALSSFGIAACNGKPAGDGRIDPPSSAPKPQG